MKKTEHQLASGVKRLSLHISHTFIPKDSYISCKNTLCILLISDAFLRKYFALEQLGRVNGSRNGLEYTGN